ncbi:uncharacterized protein LOC143000892 [Genypterus blacodes]|uniref:uncharacterized protein LOC143000892 n=1 Tax=Genypterus blacodes TaxID=154954 RepID=UPI003F763182
MQWILFSVCLTGATLLANCTPENVATNGTTSQSSIYEIHVSSRAIDGDKTLCAHTRCDENPWWMIDLLGIYNIFNISIYNKVGDTDTRLNKAEIRVGYSREINHSTNTKCATIDNFTLKEWQSYQCDDKPVAGRYVSVQYQETKNLILCEVKIHGTKKESPNKLMLYNMTKTWEDALDYCRENHKDIASIPDRETQTRAELAAMEAGTHSVWLGLRYTCVLEFWFWVDNENLEFSHWAPGNDTTPADCDMSGAMETSGGHRWVRLPDDTKLNFICVV